jgi:hypothetical protein
MHFCNICNYLTKNSYSLKLHLKSNKHINIFNTLNKVNDNNKETINIETIVVETISQETISQEIISEETIDVENIIEESINENIKNIFKCSFCDKEYVYNSGLSRHKKICKKKPVDVLIISEMKRIKNEYESKLKIKDKDLKIKDKDLKIKELENKNLQLQLKNIIASNNINNNTNINIINNNINNINISKLDYLNLNFSNVIDFDTFLDNFNNKYCLTEKQTHKILKNYLKDGIDSYISTVDYYVKDSAIRQYNDLGIIVSHNTVVLPFLSPDKSLREYFKKIVIWNKTTDKEPIEKIITIINNKIFKDTKFLINFSNQQKNKTANGFLKKASYSNATKDLIVKYN